MQRRLPFVKGCTLIALAAMMSAALNACGPVSSGSSAPPASATAPSSSASSSEVSASSGGVYTGDPVGDDQMTEWKQGAGKPVTLSCFIDGALDNSQYGKDMVSKTLTEKTGVTFKFDIVPNDNGAKLMLLISSGQLPDLIFTAPQSAQGVALIKNDKVWTADDLLGQYAPNALKGSFFTQNNRKIYALTQQGKCYGVPAWFVNRNYMDTGVFINQGPIYYVRQDLLDAVGMSTITNLDELEQALLKIKAKNPDLKHPLFLWNAANGGKALGQDTASGVNTLYYSMGGSVNGSGQYLNKDGQILSCVRDPLYKQTILYVNKLYGEGLVNASDFTDTYDTQQTVNNQPTWAVATSSGWKAIVPHDTLKAADPKMVVNTITPLANSGVKYAPPLSGMNGWSVLQVSKVSKNAERCAWLIEYLLTDEGQMLVMAGVEGTDWQWGGPTNNWVIPTGHAADLMKNGFDAWSQGLGVYKYMFGGMGYLDSAVSWGQSYGNDFMMKVYKDESVGVDNTIYTGIEPDPGSDEDVINTKFNQLVNTMIASAC
ncbi:MAG: hypothetical protein FWC62_03970, partial [Firmicutes bacterium]|nr:hypothetical protein [Bacillota bacterium]